MIQIYCVQPKRNLKLTKQLPTSYANVSCFIDELIENMYFIALKYNILNNNFFKAEFILYVLTVCCTDR